MPPSAYFAFCEAQRPAVTEELREAAGGAAISGAVVAKALGERWRALDEEAKAGFKAAAQEKAEKAAAEREAAGSAEPAAACATGRKRKARRGPTAYFLFMESKRAEVQAELAVAADRVTCSPLGSHSADTWKNILGGGKVGVAEVAKAIGERWRGLSEEEREQFKAAAAQKAAEAEAEAEEDAEGDDEGDDEARQQAAKPGPLPLGTIKRIMAADDEFGRISGDGLKHVSAATELFLGLLAKKAARQAARKKRTTIKFGDVLAAARLDHRMLPVCDLLGTDAAFAEIRGDGPGPLGEVDGNAAGAAGSSKAASKPQKEDTTARRITEFFKA
eukprot:jgi/Tetstr1/432830/TSEL_022181.t1